MHTHVSTRGHKIARVVAALLALACIAWVATANPLVFPGAVPVPEHLEGDILQLEWGERCFLAVDPRPGYIVKDYGRAIGKYEIRSELECPMRCNASADCNSFIVCTATRLCFLKDKVLAGSESIHNFGYGCRSFMSISCFPPSRASSTTVGVAAGQAPTGKPTREWTQVPNCDLPNQHDAETVHSTDIAELTRLADQKGYSGFCVRDGAAHMKRTEMPLTSSNLTCGVLGDCTFYLPPGPAGSGASTPLDREPPAMPSVPIEPYSNSHAPFNHTCSAIGEDCSQTRCCSTPFSACFERNASLAVCATNCTPGMRDGVRWSCKATGVVKVVHFSLFCFSVVQSTGSDFEFVRSQLQTGEGIAACDDYIVFSDASVELLTSDSRTVPIGNFQERPGAPSELSAGTYFAVWKALCDHYIWREYDWTVKVDSHTLLLPRQLKVYLMQHYATLHALLRRPGIYLNACNGTGLTSALQVVSQYAMVELALAQDECAAFAATEMPEEVWFQQCMKTLKCDTVALPIMDDSVCRGVPNVLPTCTFEHAAFHPLNSPAAVDACLRLAQAR